MQNRLNLNSRAAALVEAAIQRAEELRIHLHTLPAGGRILDFGIEACGGLEAGIQLAKICLAGLGEVSLVEGYLLGGPVPWVQVATDQPVAACLASQYAGWAIRAGSYFAMGSGPMRAAYGGEEFFQKIGCTERPEDQVVGVLETRALPPAEVFEWIAAKIGVAPRQVTLCAAPTASLAATVQIVARSVETALHKLLTLGFDVSRVVSGRGVAPLPPVMRWKDAGRKDLEALGRTNDSILYGGQVILRVKGDEDSLLEIGPKIPSLASPDHGAPFLEIFERYGWDFYKIDPLLFSPAKVILESLASGRAHSFGAIDEELVMRSWIIER
ncbi:MAG: methenyltetrahydromethanopterin cyclohydrolase [Planctomycetes bacterium]|nr:methenyltetrahydromethanopterin cyclohydrolase [Planctomycetota bacterium]